MLIGLVLPIDRFTVTSYSHRGLRVVSYVGDIGRCWFDEKRTRAAIDAYRRATGKSGMPTSYCSMFNPAARY